MLAYSCCCFNQFAFNEKYCLYSGVYVLVCLILTFLSPPVKYITVMNRLLICCALIILKYGPVSFATCLKNILELRIN